VVFQRQKLLGSFSEGVANAAPNAKELGYVHPEVLPYVAEDLDLADLLRVSLANVALREWTRRRGVPELDILFDHHHHLARRPRLADR
jgi:hypothetical protein